MSNPEIALDGVTKRYAPDSPPAVDALSLEIERGEIVALFGPSGCGKTTTLRLIAGFERADEGTVRVAGRLVDGQGELVPPEARGIGFVFQDYALFPHLTVGRNVAFGLRGMSRSARTERVNDVLKLSALEGLEHRYPHELSGGQQQRVAVARALAPDFPVVLLDEPLSNLDLSLRASLRAELRRILKGSGKTVLLVTHDREEAFEMADRIGVLFRGKLVQVGSPESLHERPLSVEVARLVCDGSFLPGRIENGRVSTELGMLPLQPASRTSAVGNVTVFVREDAARVRPDEAGPGVVERSVFRGPGYLVHVRLPSGTEIRCRHDEGRAIEAGRRVRITVEAEDVQILPERRGPF